MSLLVVPILPRARFLSGLFVTSVRTSWHWLPSFLLLESHLTLRTIVPDMPRRSDLALLHVDIHESETEYHPY